ncbi:MAG: ACP S-malonyltransferase [bacterium]|nr:ACP S-malonyltransferase [bacterium]
MKLAVVFPGQGSQVVGMGADWYAQCPAAHDVFELADARLGFALSTLCFKGPEEELRLTANTQPAILATSIAVWECIGAEVTTPAYFAGHSLGEYSALVASGSLELGDALSLVRERGRLMQEAVPYGEGAMAAVIGLGSDVVEQICHEITHLLGQPVELANFNSLEQVVVSGAVDSVQTAMARFTEAGAKCVVELPVSAPFHSSLMVRAADGLQPTLAATEFSVPTTSVVANLTAQPYPDDPEQFPLILAAQIYNSVRWVQTVQYFTEQGVTHVLEVGPGRVLRMLTMKIAPGIKAMNIEERAQFDGLREWLSAEQERADG